MRINSISKRAAHKEYRRSTLLTVLSFLVLGTLVLLEYMSISTMPFFVVPVTGFMLLLYGGTNLYWSMSGTRLNSKHPLLRIVLMVDICIAYTGFLLILLF
jgi:hypothetical protein